MAKYVLASLADADVEEIWFYVAQYDSKSADTYVQHLAAEFSFLAENPEAGKRRPDLGPDLRFFPYRRYFSIIQLNPVLRFLESCTELKILKLSFRILRAIAKTGIRGFSARSKQKR